MGSVTRLAGALVLLLSTTAAPSASAQSDSVTVVAGSRYAAGGLRRFFLGDTYRDMWTAPVRVPVIDLGSFAGGLVPLKAGGGNTTRNLRFEAANGRQYVFRFVDKDNVPLPDGFEGSIVEMIARDQVSSNHPAGQVVAALLLEAAGLLHVTPVHAVLPDDPRLGEFREEYAGRLGTMEEYPIEVEGHPAFAGATRIIDSDSLLPLLNASPADRIAAEEFLAVRLLDMLINDWDRHPGQWKWARFGTGPGPWRPIARDRDKAFIGFGGIAAAAGRVAANLVTFTTDYPGMKSFTWNSLQFDRRLLAGLDRGVYDSVAAVLVRRITDEVIDAAVRVMPPEYLALSDHVAPTLKVRRDSLPAVARRFHDYLAGYVDIHATDAADQAAVTRLPDGAVAVRLLSADGRPYFERRFLPAETREIRLYLHGGDDAAVVAGRVDSSIPVRIIGGMGANRLTDSSTVGGRPAARLYDNGIGDDIRYGPDTAFNRRPWIDNGQKRVPPARDYGSKLGPATSLRVDGDFGVTVKLGLQGESYAFRNHPYHRWGYTTAEYSTRIGGFRVTSFVDQRQASSPIHFTARARMSELEITSFQGLGNDSPDVPGDSAVVRQQQWSFTPAIAFALGPRSDLAFGPVLQYNTMTDRPGTFVTRTTPYGAGSFGQAGLRLSLTHDGRDHTKDPRKGLLLDFNGAWYPGVWDVATAFASLGGTAAVYYTMPIPVRPILVLRGSGKKLFGDFPFHEAAFVGGRDGVRRLERQRYAGDAALLGTAELQIPIADFALILPLDVGLYGYADAGRVYVDGASPGGWHTGAGAGIWVGVVNPTTALGVEVGDHRGRTLLRLRTRATF